MGITKKFLEDLRNKEFQFEWSSQILDASEEELQEILKITRAITDENFGKTLKMFYPGRAFPAVSITGTNCQLNCAHCDRHYLSSMLNAETPDKLWKIAEKLVARGSIGCLLSGGYDSEAHVPFENSLDVLKRIKNETNLILNAHVGLPKRGLIQKLEEIGIDIVSFDFVGSNETIKNVYGLDRTVEDYFETLQLLMASKIPYIIPHICVGLDFGKIQGEIHALEMIKKLNPSTIVILALIPTRGTLMETVHGDPLDLVKVVAISRLIFPKTEINLGCMRPKKDRDNNQRLVLAGINGMVLPPRDFLNELKAQGYEIKKYDNCCAVPVELLKKI